MGNGIGDLEARVAGELPTVGCSTEIVECCLEDQDLV